VRYCRLKNFLLRCIEDGAAVARAVRLVGTAHNNEFNNFTIGRAGGTGTRRFTLGIEEEAAADDENSYTNINGLDCVTAALKLRGAGSKVGGGNKGRILFA